MKLLSLDSSAVTAACAVTEDDRVLADSFVNVGLTHSETLLPLIKQTLKNAKCELCDIDLIAVTNGPGSFTGVRIGVSTVLGLAYPRNTGCIGVSTLEAIACAFVGLEALVCAVMDARCGQVYNALFRVSGDKVTRLCEDRAISIEELKKELSELSEPITLSGDGAGLCFERLKDEVSGVSLAPQGLRYQNACGVAYAALLLHGTDKAVPASELRPVYLRVPQAERELKMKKTEV